MKILMIHPHDIWAIEEPWTSRIRYIAREFVKAGHEVRLMYFAYPGREHIEPQTDIFTSYRLRRRQWSILRNIYEITKHAAWADIIHFQKCFAYASIPAVYAHILTNTPIHYDWDDWEMQIYKASCSYTLGEKLLWYIEKTLPALVDTISVASNALRDIAIQLHFPPERIFEAHVCADLERFKPLVNGEAIRERFSITKPVVVYMGQLNGAQYADLFIEVAERVLRKKDVLFMIIGSGDREPLLVQQVVEHKLSDKVIFTGPVDHDEIPDYLSICDVAVACFEDNEQTRCKSPLKVVEYMACGKAIVASDVGEVKRMLGGCGLLAKPGDATSLGEGILDLLKSKRRRQQMGTLARKNAEERFAWSVTANNLLTAYKTAIHLYSQ